MEAAQRAGDANTARRLQRQLGEYWHGDPARGESYLRASLAAADAQVAHAEDDAARDCAPFGGGDAVEPGGFRGLSNLSISNLF